MVKEIDTVFSEKRIQHNGDLHVTGDIGNNATIIINNGGLIVDGDLGEGVRIIIKTSRLDCFFKRDHSVLIKGDVGDHVHITTSVWGDITIEGAMGNHVRLHAGKGNIAFANVGDDSDIETALGAIRGGDIGKRTMLTANMNKVEVGCLGARSEVKAGSEIKLTSIDASASVRFYGGSRGRLYINGKCQGSPSQMAKRA